MTYSEKKGYKISYSQKACIDFEMMAYIDYASQDNNGVDIFNEIGRELQYSFI